jgi:hypothetical protein
MFHISMYTRFVINPFVTRFGRIIIKNVKSFFYIKGEDVYNKS